MLERLLNGRKISLRLRSVASSGVIQETQILGSYSITELIDNAEGAIATPISGRMKSAVVSMACATPGIANCVELSSVNQNASVPQLIGSLCAGIRSASGTLDVAQATLDCIQFSARASQDPTLIGLIENCFEAHSQFSQSFGSRRIACVWRTLHDAQGGSQ